MKLIHALFILFLFMVQMNLKAQNSEFGVLAGSNVNFIVQKSFFPNVRFGPSEPAVGVQAGVFFRRKVNDKLSAYSTLSFEMKNFFQGSRSNMNPWDQLLYYHYALLGVGVEYNFYKNFYAGAGLAGGLTVHSIIIQNKYDISYQFKAGYRFNKFSLELLLDRSMIPFMQSEDFNQISASRSHRLLKINVLVPLKKW